jgi:hypothetical protein
MLLHSEYSHDELNRISFLPSLSASLKDSKTARSVFQYSRTIAADSFDSVPKSHGLV